MSGDLLKSEARIKKQYETRFKSLLANKTQQEKEEILIGENYALKGSLAMAMEQVADLEKRVTIAGKYTLVKGKLAYDGVVCEEQTP